MMENKLLNGNSVSETIQLLLNMSATMLLTAKFYWLSLSYCSSYMLVSLVNKFATMILIN